MYPWRALLLGGLIQSKERRHGRHRQDIRDGRSQTVRLPKEFARVDGLTFEEWLT